MGTAMRNRETLKFLRHLRSARWYCRGTGTGTGTGTAQLAVGYRPQQVERQIQQLEQFEQCRNVGACKRGTFRMILPPPNVTGNLHLGHALMAIVQDVICRQRRQLGYDVEWIPGTDHAGIATQVVVEKRLLKERGLSRHQLGRAAFLERVWQWKQEKGSGIVDDLKKLGCTLSWDKEYFTMDERQEHAVNTAFIQLFEEGLISRRQSLVNWSCALESAISDIEVDTVDINGPTEIVVPGYATNITFGKLYDISYRVCGTDNDAEEVIVSTTRPETLLGDVAVAVHPEDERYIKYREMPEVMLWHPFRKTPIPLVFDISVEREFGTGAVKITPAHDRKDFDIATRHLLDAIQVFNEQGRVLDEFADFKELPRFEARDRILQRLAEMQLLRATRDHAMQLPICSRSKDVIEYMLRPQWFLHCQPMADAAISEVLSGRLQILPPNFELEWHRWLEHCHDWCISRQLWWGHQIPAYCVKDSAGNTSFWVAAHNEAEARDKARDQLQSNDFQLERDADVLDTWFSSALLPFSVANWPASEYKKQYPLDLIETGHDILFFWVARMAMLGLKLTGEMPFKKILLNGIVCDAHGRKMSKSLGNVVTPQQVVRGASTEALEAEVQKFYDSGVLSADELSKSIKGLHKIFPNGIQECGTDALRFTLCSHNIKSHFINFDVSECHTNKLFLNKIWQATRFVLGAAARLQFPLHELESMNQVPLGKWDRWILSRLAHTLKTCALSTDTYNLHTATAALKHFFYTNLCDVYLETTKSDINAGNSSGYHHCAALVTSLSWGLQALQPFTPFIADELLQHLPQSIQLDLSRFSDQQLELEIAEVLNICQCVRQLKSANKISKKHDPQVYLFAHSAAALKTLQPHLSEMKALTLTNGVHLELIKDQVDNSKRFAFELFSTAGHLCSFGLTTNDVYKQTAHKLKTSGNLNDKKLLKLEAELVRYRLRIDNEGFRKSASPAVQQKHMQKIEKLESEIYNIKMLPS